jgi:lipid-A-disaccharide synthase
VTALVPMEKLAVVGIIEVLAHLPAILSARSVLHAKLRDGQTRLLVPIDYPGFNLPLAAFAHARGVPVLYYIAPQVWAWHASRAADLARDADEVAVILPFEEEFLRRAGASATFVGHPLLDAPPPAAPREAWLREAGLDPERPVLALFPGSRAQEVKRHLAVFSGAAREVIRRVPGTQPAIGVAPHLEPSVFDGAGWPLVGDARALLHHATAALVKSGTTTLEAALAGTPCVVAYRMNPLSYAAARRLVKVPHVALANLVAGRRLAPELLQDAATPEALAAELVPLLDEASPARVAMLEGFREVREALGGAGASERVAEAAARLLRRGR